MAGAPESSRGGRGRARPPKGLPLPDVLHFTRWQDYVRAYVAARKERSPSYSVPVLARRARVPYLRLNLALRRAGPLSSEDLEGISRHLGHKPEQARFFALLVALDDAEDATAGRRALEGLVAILAEQAQARRQGPAFRARSRWTHWMGSALLAQGLARTPDALAQALGVSGELAREVLADLDALGPAHEASLHLHVTGDADLPRLLLMDDLLQIGMRTMERRAEPRYAGFAHQAHPLSAVAAQAGRVHAIHGEPAPTSEGARRTPLLLLSHSVPVTRPLSPPRPDPAGGTSEPS